MDFVKRPFEEVYYVVPISYYTYSDQLRHFSGISLSLRGTGLIISKIYWHCCCQWVSGSERCLCKGLE